MSDSFLFMADAHIKARTWQNNPRLSGDAYRSLQLLTKELERMDKQNCQITAKSDTLVIGGDWFDNTRPSSRDLMESFKFFGRFRRVYFICGNHDKTDPPLVEVAYAVNDCKNGTVRLCSQLARLGAGRVIAGISWTPDVADLKNKLAEVAGAYNESDETHLFLVLHTAFRHLLSFDGSWQLEADDIVKLFPDKQVTVLVGDIHTRNTLQASDNVTIHSPGALYPLSRDKLHSACAVSEVCTTDGRITEVSVAARPILDIPFTSLEDLETQVTAACVAADLNEQLSPLVLLSVSETDVLDLSALPKDVVVELERTFSDTPLDVLEQSQTGQTLDDALRCELPDVDEASLALALLHSDDPVADMADWIDYWGVECVL